MEISDELRKLVDSNNECCCEHSLGNKCKQWAFNRMFFLSSGFDTDGAFCLDRMNSKSFIAETEPEAIFKACQWILDNKTN